MPTDDDILRQALALRKAKRGGGKLYAEKLKTTAKSPATPKPQQASPLLRKQRAPKLTP